VEVFIMNKILSALVNAGVVSFASDGSIDLSATAENVKARLAEEEIANRAEDGAIEEALVATFAMLGLEVVPAPTLTAMAAVSLAGNTPVRVAEYQGKVTEYLGRSARFEGKRGRNGGIVKKW
jgi:hypothetical protein